MYVYNWCLISESLWQINAFASTEKRNEVEKKGNNPVENNSS